MPKNKTRSKTTVTPWEVKGSDDGINYRKLIDKFGCDPIDGSLIKRFEQVTGVRAHTWLRRGLFFSNKQLSDILDRFENKKPIYIYTGRGPSSDSMHLGHMIPFLFTRYLQEALGAVVVIQMSDDEKFYFKGKTSDDLEKFNEYTYSNAPDIIACGFELNKTYMFSNLEAFGGSLYKNAAKIMKLIRGNQIRGIYGLTLENNIGQLIWPALQCAPAYSSSFPSIFGKESVPCLVPMAIDQDPYFRMARDVADRIGSPKPSTIHSQFLVGLGGIKDKMNTTGDNANTTLFLNATPESVRKNIMRHAFSGGGATLKEHRQHGGDLRTDVAFQYLLYFEHDDGKLADIARRYRSGDLLSGDIKKLMADAVCAFLEEHQKKRAQLTPEVIQEYFKLDREFDLSLPERPSLELSSDEQYDRWGIDFDTSFGAGHKQPAEEQEQKQEQESATQDQRSSSARPFFNSPGREADTSVSSSYTPARRGW